MDFGHAAVLVLILVGGFFLWKYPGKVPDPTLRKFAWGVWCLFTVAWLGWAFGCFAAAAA